MSSVRMIPLHPDKVIPETEVHRRGADPAVPITDDVAGAIVVVHTVVDIDPATTVTDDVVLTPV